MSVLSPYNDKDKDKYYDFFPNTVIYEDTKINTHEGKEAKKTKFPVSKKKNSK